MQRLLILCCCILGVSVPRLQAAAPVPQQIAERVDHAIEQALFNDETSLASPANDEVIVRRLYLDLIGDIPTPEEAAAYLLDPAAEKREKLIDRLLANPRYGQNWARYWRDVVFYRAQEDRAAIAAPAMEADLAKWLNEGQSWKDIASKFITSKGDVRENGSTAIIMAQDGRTEETTAEIARIFLGIQIQCAQCHDHPYDSWKREQFHELAAFFPRITVRPVRDITRRSFEVAGTDRFRRNNRPNNERLPTAEHHMPDLNNPQATGTMMQPKFFLTGSKFPFGTTDADRRGQLAEWLTENEWFATAVSNRMWAELVGEGYYPVVDDIGPEREPVAPTAIKVLSSKFAASDFDLKWLLKTICLTEAYGREARPLRLSSEAPFTANIPQRLRSDQLLNALYTALEVEERIDQRPRPQARMVSQQRQRFDEVFGYDPSLSREEAVSSIPQVLALMNSPDVNRVITARTGNLLQRLMSEIPDDRELVTELYFRCLSREPESEELAAFAEYRDSASGRKQAFEDLVWSLVNSTEFQYRP